MIKSLPARWKEQYKRWKGTLACGHTPDWYLKKIEALNLDKVSSKDVKKATGLTGWTDLSCGECGKKVEVVVELGRVPHWSESVQVCLKCIEKALKQLNGENK